MYKRYFYSVIVKISEQFFNSNRLLYAFPLKELTLKELVKRGVCNVVLWSMNLLTEPVKGLSVQNIERNGFGKKCVMFIGSLNVGGAETQLVQLAVELVANQQFTELKIITLADLPDVDNHLYAKCRKHKIIVEAISSYTDVHVVDDTAPNWLTIRWQPYLNAIHAERPDIVHLWMDEINTIGGLSAFKLGVPTIVLSGRSQAPYHFIFYQSWMRKGYEFLLEQRSVKFIVNSEAGVNDYKNWIHAKGDKIVCIYNGYKISVAHNLSFTPIQSHVNENSPTNDRLRLIAVGRLSEEKQPFYLIKMINRLSFLRPNMTFTWIGDGVLSDEVDGQISMIDKSILRRVRYSNDIIAELQNHDALILPSRIEGLPNVIVEAQSLGIPVFTPAYGGAQEAFIPGVTGEILPPRDPEGAASVLIDFLENEDSMTGCAVAAKQFVIERFDLQRMVSATIKCYNENKE